MGNHQPSVQFKIPEKLPVFLRSEEIISAIHSNQVVVISGETGSGKSTILPLLCIKAGCIKRGRLAVTQPRRLAALSLARYVSSLLQPAIKNYVGSKVRFHDTISAKTKIKFVTDGILLAEMSSDPLLSQYDTIIVDEAHERTCNIDFLLGYLRTLLLKRPCLKLIISSATLDTELFSLSLHG